MDEQSTVSSDTHTTKLSKIKSEFKHLTAETKVILNTDIWELEHLNRRTFQARIYEILRVLSLTIQGLQRNKIPVQAAALTFYSLIGLGPLTALAIMLSGFAIEKGNEAIIIEKMVSAIAFAAPQVALSTEAAGEAASMTPEMVALINNFTQAAQSGTVGLVGIITLFVIAMQVLTSIESAFNTLWGVEKGRKFGERIITYWTFISLGAVLGAGGVTLLTLRTISAFVEKLPFGGNILDIILMFSPIVSFSLFTLVLATFFRFIPHTHVKWRPAFTGAAFVVLALHVYNMLSFLYVQRVVDTRSLYGSVGIIVVLMLGLFIFWLLILLGGQLTYALQNANYLTHEGAWQSSSERTREIVSLGILLCIAKRFKAQEPPLRASEIHQQLRTPSQILNLCISRLCDLNYLCVIDSQQDIHQRDKAYQAARPLEKVTLGELKHDLETHGNNEGGDLLARSNIGISTYVDELLTLKGNEASHKTIGELI